MISKQTQKAFSYIFAVLAIVLGSVFLVTLAQGYRYDFLTGQIRESGLVLIDSTPSGADIYINGKHTRNTTAHRISDAPVGPMKVELIKPDYRVWTKNLIVQAQQVSYADYALLLPQTLKYSSYLPDYKVTQLIESQNKKRTFIATSKPRPAIWQLNGDQAPTLYYDAPPAATDATVGLVSTNADGSTLIATQTAAGSTSYLAIAGPQATLNLTANLQISSGNLSVNPANNKELYWLATDKTLRKVNLSGQTIGPVLEQGVVGMKAVGGDVYTIIAPSEQNARPSLWKLDPNSGHKSQINVILPQSSSFQLDYAQSSDGPYLAVLSNDTKELMVIKKITDKKPLTGLLGKSVTAFTIGNNGEYIVYNAGGKMLTYDINLAERYGADVSLQGLKSWNWLDEQHLVVVANNQLRLIDYDGQNDQIVSDHGDNVSDASIASPTRPVVFISAAGIRSVSLQAK